MPFPVRQQQDIRKNEDIEAFIYTLIQKGEMRPRLPVEFISQLPIAGNEVDDIITVKEDGYVRYRDGGQWLLISTLLSSFNGTFTGLSDSPNSYAGDGGKTVVVNQLGTGLEFISKGSSFQGVRDASGGTVPATKTNGDPIEAGDNRMISVSGTIIGIGGLDDLEVYDTIKALVNTPAANADRYGIQANTDGTDPNAIHSDVANEFPAIVEKVLPVGDDVVLIEDSEDLFNKKKVLVKNLPRYNGFAFWAANTF